MACLTQIKRKELEHMIDNYSPDIVGLTEIFRKQYLYELIEHYDTFLGSIGQGRGVIHYVKSKVLASSVSFQNAFNDSACPLLLGCVYRSPNSSLENSEHLSTQLKKSEPGETLASSGNGRF